MNMWMIVILAINTQNYILVQYSSEDACKEDIVNVQKKYSDRSQYYSNFKCNEGTDIKHLKYND